MPAFLNTIVKDIKFRLFPKICGAPQTIESWIENALETPVLYPIPYTLLGVKFVLVHF